MPDSQQDDIDRIERERRRHERDLMILLLALFSSARSHALYAARSNNDPLVACRMVVLGDNGGHFIGAAPLIAQAQVKAFEAGVKRAQRLAEVPSQKVSLDEYQKAVDHYLAKAKQYADSTADKLTAGIGRVERIAPTPKDELNGIRQVFTDLRITRTSPAYLEAEVERKICSAYSDGMSTGYAMPAVALKIKGLRHVSVLDNHTTDICANRDQVRRPVDDDWWLRNTPPLHYGCRSILLPILGDFDPTPPEALALMPPPMEGFGIGRVSAALALSRSTPVIIPAPLVPAIEPIRGGKWTKHQGARVLIAGGKIVKGPGHLIGKSVR